MIALNQAISNISPSPTHAANRRAKELIALGKDIESFTLGEPDFDTPQHVKDAAVEALKNGQTKYTIVGGIPELRDAICAKVKRDQGLDFSSQQVIVTNGGKQALATACAVLLEPGEEVIIPAPYWTSYPDMVKLAGGVPVIVETTAEDGYMMSAEALLKACTPKTRAIILNTPSNPTGACYGREELRAIAEAVISLNNPRLLVITDEVYEYITYDGFEHVSFMNVAPELRENTLLVNAFSKAYSMTGWRVGYAVGPQDLIAAMNKHQSQFTANVCSIAQHAAAKAYDDDYAFPKMMAAEFAKRREIVCEAIADTPGISLEPNPRGAFFAFMQVDGLIGKRCGEFLIESGADFTRFLMEKHDVVVVQGDAFGAPNAVRLSFAASTERLTRGLDRIRIAASQLE